MRAPSRLALAVLPLLAFACRDSVSPDAAGPRPTDARAQLAAPETLFAERFTRATGTPVTVTRTISTADFQAPFTVTVRNGDVSGAHRVSSAIVTLDGATILHPSDFNQSAAEWTIPVTLGTSATLTVELRGAPGSYLDVAIQGVRAAVTFCPGGPAGTYDDLREAVIATPSGGTILVCDGDFAIDSVLIDRPLTLRAEHSGMATLRDADPAPVGQGGFRPALVVDDIASGLVRVVDLNFVVGGSVLQAGPNGSATESTWDQIHVDSVRVYARTPGSTVTFAIRTNLSTVEGARLEVTNSYFEDLFNAVFAVAEEVNVRNSTFERNERGMIYSSQGGHGVTENNVFRGCGIAGCIRVLVHGGITIRNNLVETGPIAGARLAGIVVNPGNAERPNVLVENNTVIGYRNEGAPADQQAGWADQAGILVGPGQELHVELRGNRVSNTFVGYSLGGFSAATIDAHDNFATGGAYVLQRNGTAEVVFTRNDAEGQLRSVRGSATMTGHYRCNWWGSAAGPVLPDANIPGHMYTPWATTPVAGTNTPCDPTPYQTVLVCPVGGTSPTYPTVAQGVSFVAEGGTVLVCDGTHVVQNQPLTKSLTLAAQGPGMPTLDALGAGLMFNVNNTPADVTIRGLRLRGAGNSIIQTLNLTGRLRVEGAELHPRQTVAYSPDMSHFIRGFATAITSFGRLTRLEVENSTILGGDVGLNLSAGNPASGSVLVRGNTFDGQATASMTGGNVPLGLTVEGNTFRNCSRMACVELFASNDWPVTYEGNRFEIDIARRSWFPLMVSLMPAGSATIRGNEFVGIGDGGGARTTNAPYPIDGFAIQFAGASADISGNRFENAFAAVNMTPGALTGSDNRVHHVAYVLSSGGDLATSSASWQRNDFTDIAGISQYGNGHYAMLDLRCNWWGSAGGPPAASVGGLPATVFMPFATQPIAGESFACSP